MVGHIAQTGQIVATNFRTGNVSPAKDNLDIIKISQDALPKGTNIKKLRIDAAGYQASIIDYCFEHDIEFSIRAKICQSLKDIFVDKDNPWQPLVDKKGKAIDGQATFRMRHFIGNNGKVFDLIVQRSSIRPCKPDCVNPHIKCSNWNNVMKPEI